MKIVTDSGVDLPQALIQELGIHVVPLTITLGDTDYRAGIDIQSDAFYQLLRSSEHFPTTSQPSPADFQQVYQELVAQDSTIISIHMSGKMSGTVNAARLGAQHVMDDTEAHITVIDSRHVSATLGFMVEAAARAAQAGWQPNDVVHLVERVGQAAKIVFSPDDIKYLVNGGRVSHLRGFAASMLNIKPILMVTHDSGRVESKATVRTMKKALVKQVDIIATEHGMDTALHVQIVHADNPEMANYLRELVIQRFECHFLPDTSISPLVGAHTGPGLVGVAYAPSSVFEGIPL